MGFVDDIIKISTHLPKNKQTLMFSATMAPKIRTFAARLLKEPEQISIAISKIADGVIQGAYMVYNPQKNNLIISLLKDKEYASVIIFSSTKKNVKALERDLHKSGLKVRSIHSDLDQTEREDVLRGFKNKKIQILVATDILSRGIDIEDIGLVINYDVPNDPADYVHRVGRTARASSTGVALTFINEYDQHYFGQIETLIEKEVQKLELPRGFEKGPDYNPDARPPKKPFNKKKSFNNRPRR
jgi:superfamily II DNA/RNA helicase